MQRVMQRVNNLTDRQVLYLLVVVVLVTSSWSAILNLTSGQPDFQAWGEGWLQNFSTEMTGAISTFWLFSLVIGNRQDKKRLIIQMRSKDNATALQAVEELREMSDWLQDDSLQGAYLGRANLANASLGRANLQGADLRNANLAGAYLRHASLAGANLERANLKGARLRAAKLDSGYLWAANLANASLGRANLKGANLEFANLAGANLEHATLKGASLEFANLKGANLVHTKFDETTTLPDKTNWTPDTDMTRFTDPNHPDFWRSDSKYSPAYRGDSSDQPPPGE